MTRAIIKIVALILTAASMAVCGVCSAGPDASRTAESQPPATPFLDNHDGTVTDTKTGLMWAARDNGMDITWKDAVSHCASFRGGGYCDWRMPTIAELRSLFDLAYERQARCGFHLQLHLTPAIDVSCLWVWSSDSEDSSTAQSFGFDVGVAHRSVRSYSSYYRALSVRSLNASTSVGAKEPEQHAGGPELSERAATVSEPKPPESGQREKVQVEKRFVDNRDGTVSDVQTGLMWAARDNGADITWDDATAYCENYSAAGYTDWRLPTVAELKTLCDKRYWNLTSMGTAACLPLEIRLSCHWVWSSEVRTAWSANKFNFGSCLDAPSYRSVSFATRALPVRSQH